MLGLKMSDLAPHMRDCHRRDSKILADLFGRLETLLVPQTGVPHADQYSTRRQISMTPNGSQGNAIAGQIQGREKILALVCTSEDQQRCRRGAQRQVRVSCMTTA